MSKKELGYKIAVIRRNKKITQQALAEQLDIYSRTHNIMSTNWIPHHYSVYNIGFTLFKVSIL